MGFNLYDTLGLDKVNLGDFGNAALRTATNGQSPNQTLSEYMQENYGPNNTPPDDFAKNQQATGANIMKAIASFLI